MDKLKRATKGGIVQAEVDGTWEIGHIVDFDKDNIAFINAAGDKTLVVPRADVYKATRAAYEAAMFGKAEPEDEGAEPEEEGAEPHTGMVPEKYRRKYIKTKSPMGNSSAVCGDEVSIALHNMDLSDVYDIAERITGKDLRARYGHLNRGQQRMALGNLIRGRCKKDPEVFKANFGG